VAYFIELTEAESNARTWVNLGRVNRFVQSAGGNSVAHFENGVRLDIRESMAEVLTQIPQNLREGQEFEE
jgi:hypothetical protein